MVSVSPLLVLVWCVYKFVGVSGCMGVSLFFYLGYEDQTHILLFDWTISSGIPLHITIISITHSLPSFAYCDEQVKTSQSPWRKKYFSHLSQGFQSKVLCACCPERMASQHVITGKQVDKGACFIVDKG